MLCKGVLLSSPSYSINSVPRRRRMLTQTCTLYTPLSHRAWTTAIVCTPDAKSPFYRDYSVYKKHVPRACYNYILNAPPRSPKFAITIIFYSTNYIAPVVSRPRIYYKLYSLMYRQTNVFPAPEMESSRPWPWPRGSSRPANGALALALASQSNLTFLGFSLEPKIATSTSDLAQLSCVAIA